MDEVWLPPDSVPVGMIDSLYAEIAAKVDFSFFEDLAQKHADGRDLDNNHAVKYTAYARHIKVAVRRALSLRLDTVAKKRILDIGTGMGFFPLVCRFLGHDCDATDIWYPEDHVYTEASREMDTGVRELPVMSQTPLPEVHGRFDMITAFAIAFSRHPETQALWKPEDWDYLIADLRQSYLEDDGLIWFWLNPHFPGNARYDEDLRAYFLRCADLVDGPHVILRKAA